MYDYFDKSTDPLPFNAEHGYTGVLIWKKDADYCKDVILTAFCHLLITSEATFVHFWLIKSPPPKPLIEYHYYFAGLFLR